MSAYFAIDGIANSYRKMSDLNLIQKCLGDVSIVDDINGIPIIRINTKKWDRKDKVLFVLESRIGDIIDDIEDIVKFNKEFSCFVIDADDIEKLNSKYSCWCKSGGIKNIVNDDGEIVEEDNDEKDEEWELPIVVVSGRK